MRYLTLYYLLIVFMLSQGTCVQRIDHNHILEYSITENNAVGPTTSLTLRTLDNASPSSANAVFLAMQGTTGATNFGVNAVDATAQADASAPVITFEKAIDVMIAQPTRNTIHIIRNGYVGDIVFENTDNHNALDPLPTDSIIQTELGTIALLTMKTAGILSVVSGTLIVNGLNIDVQTTIGDSFPRFGWFQADILRYKWTNIYWSLPNLIGAGPITRGFLAATTNPGIVFTNSILNCANLTASTDSDLFGNVPKVNFTDSIFMNMRLGNEATGFGFHVLSTWYYSVIYNVKRNLNNLSDSAFEAQRCIIVNSEFQESAIDAGYPYFSGIEGSLSTNNILLGNVVVAGTVISNVSPLFFNQNAFDFRLQDQRRKAPNSDQYFTVSSIAVNDPSIGQDRRGLSDPAPHRDWGPYDVSYSLISDVWASFTFEDEYWNDMVKIDPTLINRQDFHTKRGNYHRVFDALRRKLDFNVIPEGYVGTFDSYAFQDLLVDNGAKRWYPNGDDGLWVEPSGVLTKASGTWDWTATLPTIYSSDSNFYKKRFEGFIVSMNSGAYSYDLRITKNASGTLYLEDHRENQAAITAGTYNMACLYLPIEIENGDMAIEFANWMPQNNPLNPQNDLNDPDGDYRMEEGHTRSLSAWEVEEDEQRRTN